MAALALSAGCGGGGDTKLVKGKGPDRGSYEQEVLEGWSRLESSSEKLAEAAGSIEGQEDFEGFRDELEKARKKIASFQELLDGLEVPEGYAEGQASLEDFLDAYDAYLQANQETIDIVLEGEEAEELPTIAPELDAAQKAPQDYRASQDFNPAGLDEGVWDIPHILDESIESFAPIPLDIVDDWYAFFNAGDDASMYALLDMESPLRTDYDLRFFSAQIKEAYTGGLRATCRFVEAEERTDATGDWLVLTLVVDYTGTVNMEGEPVPPSSEERVFEMLNRKTAGTFTTSGPTAVPPFSEF